MDRYYPIYKRRKKPKKFLNLFLIALCLFASYFLYANFKKEKTQSTFALTELELPAHIKKADTKYQIPANLPLTPLKINEKSTDTPKSAIPQKNSTPQDTDLWQTITVKPGDSLTTIFKKIGINQKTLQIILKNNQHKKILSNIKAKTQLKFMLKDNNLQQLIIPFNIREYLLITRLNEQKYSTQVKKYKTTERNQYLTARVKGSLYNTAKNLQIPNKLIQQMTDIFIWEIDFSKEVRSGDEFSILYKAIYIEDKLVDVGNILAISYKSRSKQYNAIGHLNNGVYEYFTPEGKSLKKAFSRYPVKYSYISSPFSTARMHPSLKVVRPHKGVDLAAPIGTPVIATGDGKIAVLEAQSGYGNIIKIAHGKKYHTVYAHLLRFAKGLSVGTYVKRGQIIGYVGQTGLATGPHCHYEFHINRQPKNPTTVELPLAQSISTKEIANFKANANTMLAKLKSYENNT